MLNPWLILGLVLFWLASVTGAYFKGNMAAQNEAQAQYAKDLDSAISDHNKQAAIDAKAAADAATREATARTRTAMLRSQANEAVRNKPMPISCNLDSERVRLLVAAVEAANGDSKDAADKLRAAASKANRAIR